MFQGTVVSINITPKGAEPMTTVDEVHAFAGRGLEGDRYFGAQGTFSDTPGTGRQVTLIESEAIDAVERDCGYKLQYKDSRRNIVTHGVTLNGLVGKEFRVGDVRLLGVRLCEPCNHAFPDGNVKQALVHRGGLRADILIDGVIRVGDSVSQQ
ncbi:MAG: MOSC domain-containing protein [Dehalococcoidia bacterium]|nr:MOSC domain-containing protein [Dehalococcoidia bacterium]